MNHSGSYDAREYYDQASMLCVDFLVLLAKQALVFSPVKFFVGVFEIDGGITITSQGVLLEHGNAFVS